jgi:lipopolysaccharide/colanic/teichoic acid biosynthesis glycosyltransferase
MQNQLMTEKIPSVCDSQYHIEWDMANYPSIITPYHWQQPQGLYAKIKPLLDRIAAVILLVLTAPLILALACIVKLTSHGPAFYSQMRVGLYGRTFRLYKIRTMYHACEASTGPRWSTPGDKRVTWVGRFLRKSHLDELPQLINIIRGEMSLIGPRPERPEIIPDLERKIAHYRSRLLVRPGVTGFAQVQLAPDTCVEEVRTKLAYDLFYVRSQSLWFDLVLAFATACHFVGAGPRLIRKICRLPKAATVIRSYQDLIRWNATTNPRSTPCSV